MSPLRLGGSAGRRGAEAYEEGLSWDAAWLRTPLTPPSRPPLLWRQPSQQAQGRLQPRPGSGEEQFWRHICTVQGSFEKEKKRKKRGKDRERERKGFEGRKDLKELQLMTGFCRIIGIKK